MSLSNLHGRVLEYIIVDRLQKNLPQKIIFTNRTIENNIRDKEKISLINRDLLNHFENSSNFIVDWLSNQFHNTKPISVDRLSDTDGKNGDVTDIKLFNDEYELNLSIKNNHLATKHQRPGPTPKHLGFSLKDEEFKQFKKLYTNINNSFYCKSKNIKPQVSLYSEVEEIKFQHLYNPICNLVSDFLNRHSDRSDYYQSFLLGIVRFKKIVVFKDRIEIFSYDNIPKSLKMNSYVENDNYVKVDFNNNIVLSMRLHTASSRLSKTGSLKFDTQIEKLDVPKEVLILKG